MESEKGHIAVVSKIIHLFYSLLYSNYFPYISNNCNADSVTKKIYKDIFSIYTRDKRLNECRKKVIQKTWRSTIDYIAEIASGRIVKPVEYVFPDSIRCDMHNIPDRLTLYSVDRSTPLTAFHGSGFIDTKLRIGTRYRILLQSEHFVPVYGMMCGCDYSTQPIFYIHASYVKGRRLSDDLSGRICCR